MLDLAASRHSSCNGSAHIRISFEYIVVLLRGCRGCASFLERVLPARASLTVVLACRQCGHAGGSQAACELATLQLQGTAELA